MERNHRARAKRRSKVGGERDAIDARALTVLQRYSAGEISAREAAHELGSTATEHDVFEGMRSARLPLPSPPLEQIAREVEALRALYGPHGPRG
jgi:hypothetical protein